MTMECLGSGLTDHSQKSKVAASASAEQYTVGQRSLRVATRRPSFMHTSPAQPVPVDEDDPAQHPFVVDPWLAMALGKIRRQPRHLLVRQPL